ncbi:MAG: anhydro-N-acetylmuramic acid kinase [Bacteroidales bacterium]|jgi:anhydro-N-acetylmuramic acid kinase|nr:anhydro-N-acetylmuramic acid kinase [Bacteroidales bacterium]
MNNDLTETYKVIGLMSGTSQDGLDIVFCSFYFTDKWHFKINIAETVAYPEDIHQLLKDAFYSDKTDLEGKSRIYGEFTGKQVNVFCEKYNINPDFIASHGHTIFHKPSEGITVQIGKGDVISKICGLPVVYDFRSQDVELGGQGAPLVPIGDKLLFGGYDFCINIGGFSNISYDEYIDEKKVRVAFDICPSNIILNELSQCMGKDFDKDGEIARKGKINKNLLNDLNNLEYYKLPPPKSLGKEYVNTFFKPVYANYISNMKIKDMISTYTEHIAIQIARSIKRKGRVLITGGGAFNKYLIKRIEYYINEGEIIIPDETLVNYKEAVIFAFMGVLRMIEKVNIYSSVTGAERDHCGGRIATS